MVGQEQEDSPVPAVDDADAVAAVAAAAAFENTSRRVNNGLLCSVNAVVDLQSSGSNSNTGRLMFSDFLYTS
jgi:hypothetical protein